MSLQKTDLVVTRDYLPNDKNFILATWLRGLYYGESWYRDIPKDIFMANYHTILEKILATPGLSVKVSCLKDDNEVILGYSVYHKLNELIVLDWIFVKSAWRRIGIGKGLVPQGVMFVTHLTKVGKALMPKIPNVQFNPFLI